LSHAVSHCEERSDAAIQPYILIDQLIDRIDALGSPICVGLDPTLELIPEPLKEEAFSEFGKTPRAVGEIFAAFGMTIIDAIYDIVPAVKPQIAMYEAYGLEGLAAYQAVCRYAESKGLIVIGDVKRGDISSTASAYAAHLAGVKIEDELTYPWCEDFITVNPYLGSDGITPFTKACQETGKGIFILVRTSNPSSSEIQELEITSPNAVIQPSELLYQRVAKLVSEWGQADGLIGGYGYSSIGAVVGATHPEEGAYLRATYPNMFFLVPGYGAQGATASDISSFFDADGRGCIVNSSRGIIGAWRQTEIIDSTLTRHPERSEAESQDPAALKLVGESARAAAIAMRDDLRNAIKRSAI
jgi:orotidine-5'-phosphate decarboxylase